MKLDLVFEELLPHPVEDVWQALTDADARFRMKTKGLSAFELTPEDGGTRLRLTHEGEIDPSVGRLLTDGWPGRLALLADRVANPPA